LSFFFHLSDTPSELVTHELLRARQHFCLRLADRQPGDALELVHLFFSDRLELVLELLDVHFAVSNSLLPALDVAQPPLERPFLRSQPFLSLNRFPSPGLQLMLDLRSELHCSLLRLELCLAPNGLRFPASLGQHQLARAPRGCKLRPRLEAQSEHGRGDA